jgi:hypothetical protein
LPERSARECFPIESGEDLFGRRTEIFLDEPRYVLVARPRGLCAKPNEYRTDFLAYVGRKACFDEPRHLPDLGSESAELTQPIDDLLESRARTDHHRCRSAHTGPDHGRQSTKPTRLQNFGVVIAHVSSNHIPLRRAARHKFTPTLEARFTWT